MAAELPVPIYTELNKLYEDLGTTANHAVRWNALAEDFEKRFGRKPAYIVRAPGRVNLIGEHIDYALFGCLPAAVERDILIACAPRTLQGGNYGEVDAQNSLAKYAPARFAPTRKTSTSDQEVRVEEWHLDIDQKTLHWESYVKAGYYGVLNNFFKAGGSSASPVPVDLLVTGTVPAAGGLSSSAAMVVSSTLAFLATNNLLDGLTKSALVNMAVENERRVGVNSGGMDQSASVIATSASAIYVSFFPTLNAIPVRLPGSGFGSGEGKRAAFVIANSLVTSEKAVHARTRYNLRVVETFVGARVLCEKLGLTLKSPKERPTLREVVGRLGGEPEAGWVAGDDDDKLRAALKLALDKAEVLKPSGNGEELGVTKQTMVEWTGLTEKEFHDIFLSWIDVEATYFQLYKRAVHVFSEALRVLEFRDVCERSSNDVEGTSAAVLKELGGLMNASMESCSNVYECSCPELNQLCQIALSAGAYGSRLTGAGWGGCTVSLVDEENVGPFIKALKDQYPAYKDLEGDALSEAVFATKPSAGACVFKFEE